MWVSAHTHTHVWNTGQGLHARFSLASSSSPAVSNELHSTVLSLPLSREITLWSSSLPSPALLVTRAHSLINTSEFLRKARSFSKCSHTPHCVLYFVFLPWRELHLDLKWHHSMSSPKMCSILCNDIDVYNSCFPLIAHSVLCFSSIDWKSNSHLQYLQYCPNYGITLTCK